MSVSCTRGFHANGHVAQVAVSGVQGDPNELLLGLLSHFTDYVSVVKKEGSLYIVDNNKVSLAATTENLGKRGGYVAAAFYNAVAPDGTLATLFTSGSLSQFGSSTSSQGDTLRRFGTDTFPSGTSF